MKSTARAKDFLSCLGNGKTIIEIENDEDDSGDNIQTYKEFNAYVEKKMLPYALSKGWKIDKKYSEPTFKKGKGEVYMHIGDAVIFGTINGEFQDKKGNYYAKHHKQNMALFSGIYNKEDVDRYVRQGKQTINQIDKHIK